MTLGILPTKLGTVGGADIIAQVHSSALTGGELVKVQLSADYVRNPPPGFLLGGTPAGTLYGTNPTEWPHTIPSGTVLTVSAAEAAALVAANAATAI